MIIDNEYLNKALDYFSKKAIRLAGADVQNMNKKELFEWNNEYRFSEAAILSLRYTLEKSQPDDGSASNWRVTTPIKGYDY